jgi:hypothetical protein
VESWNRQIGSFSIGPKSGFALLGSFRCSSSELAHRSERKTGSTFPHDAL